MQELSIAKHCVFLNREKHFFILLQRGTKLFKWLLDWGYDVEQARNATLLLMVLFENIHVFNCRSETRSILRHNPLTNPILLFGTIAAQLVHIGAMYAPWLSEVLKIHPVDPELWFHLLMLALSVLVVMEVHKGFRALLRAR